MNCPHCGSSLIVEIANAKHCNGCGRDFDLNRHPLVSQAQKRKAERDAKRGWPVRE